ncbi:hypothetical protein ACVR05_07025 [Streptococcus caprae]|uniref:Flagellar FliJ protein n=1 Tax=Streptococcus caprae TaxID=1640501 RepID=A0ABV8CWC0_9STRE
MGKKFDAAHEALKKAERELEDLEVQHVKQVYQFEQRFMLLEDKKRFLENLIREKSDAVMAHLQRSIADVSEQLTVHHQMTSQFMNETEDQYRHYKRQLDDEFEYFEDNYRREHQRKIDRVTLAKRQRDLAFQEDIDDRKRDLY